MLSCSRPIGSRNTVLGLLTLLVVLLFGCGDDSAPPDSSASTHGDSLLQDVASRYLDYAYQGASLRSDHPLNDSLFALRTGKNVGGPVTLVDTFLLERQTLSARDSIHTIEVRVPHALTVSNVWTTSDPLTEHTFTLQLRGQKVSQAPRIVGWPALRSHIRKVEPDSGEAIVSRIEQRWRTLIEGRPGV